MSDLYDELSDGNLRFQRDFRRLTLGLLEDALAAERHNLTDDPRRRQLLSVGSMGVDMGGETIIMRQIPAYTEAPCGDVYNLCEFLDIVYSRAVDRLGAFAAGGSHAIAGMREELTKRKEEMYKRLSTSTVANIEELMAQDGLVLDARSKQVIDRQSFTGVRKVTESAEKTERQIEEIVREKGIDVSRLYGELQDVRLRLRSHERQQEDGLRHGAAKVVEHFEDFLAAISESLERMTDLHPASLPVVESPDDIRLTDKMNLGRLYLHLMAANRLLRPQRVAGDRGYYPMPRLVLVPVSGYVAAAPSLSVEKYRENVIFYPMRCLENPVTGLARELIVLWKKISKRQVYVQRDAFIAHCRKERLDVDNYEAAFETYLRFVLGGKRIFPSLSEGEQAVVADHFAPVYSDAMFIPPDLRPVLLELDVGVEEGRRAFNEAVTTRKSDAFVLGILHADRSRRYDKAIRQMRDDGEKDPDRENRYAASAEKNFRAALAQFDRASRISVWKEYAQYNKAIAIAMRYREDLIGDRAVEVIRLLGSFLQSVPENLWAFKASRLLEEIRARLLSPEPIAEMEGTNVSARKLAVEEGWLAKLLRRILKAIGVDA